MFAHGLEGKIFIPNVIISPFSDDVYRPLEVFFPVFGGIQWPSSARCCLGKIDDSATPPNGWIDTRYPYVVLPFELQEVFNQYDVTRNGCRLNVKKICIELFFFFSFSMSWC